MKQAVTIARWLVGGLFIASGLVKANDPLGLSYKMLEFFEIWTSDLAASNFFLKTPLLSLISFLTQHALALSIAMIVLEIMAGVALLLRWRTKGVLWLLAGLIVFFTFLTGYAYASGKFKNCGCFGDCLPISPLVSFLKDLLLLALIVFLLFFQKSIAPTKNAKNSILILTLSLCVSFGLQAYVLRYLPLVDCLPFKKGASIRAGMQPPPNAISDSFAIRFVYQKEGKTFEFSPESLPADLGTYTFVERTDKLVRKGNAEPAIKGFALNGVTRADSTKEVLDAPFAVLYFLDSEASLSAELNKNVLAIYKAARRNRIPVYVITTSIPRLLKQMPLSNLPGLQFFDVDFTIFRMAARTNPSIYVLKKGTVVQKQSRHRSDAIIDAINQIK